jgi:hypothetical protein
MVVSDLPMVVSDLPMVVCDLPTVNQCKKINGQNMIQRFRMRK